MTAVPHPLFISSRLMAAYKIDGAGTLHLHHADTRDDENRIVYTWVIEDAEGNELETGADLRSGARAEPDYVEAMGTLLSFLTAAAEHARYADDDEDPRDSMFNQATTAWALEHSSDLEMAQLDLEGDPE